MLHHQSPQAADGPSAATGPENGKLVLYFYREGEDFTLPGHFPRLPRIPLLQGANDDLTCPEGSYLTTDSPERADYIVFPYDVSPLIFKYRTIFVHFFIKSLPHFLRHERKHVFLASHDRGQPLCTDAVIFTHAPRKSNTDDGNILTFPHFPGQHVLDSAPELTFSDIRYDICFAGA
ncbi:hypothetical protein [Pseudodesulfovibrio sp.]|uniref:hypothetical protein n=1 Tax=Pseudodesulfovibrio sp. TaxID=2035812 RepID=UPI00260AEAF7|nr:hypothetical protein [Pseudodesulfovibrio sp.]MDD3313840.1 hypothetical protein [Pseudodesulfovibrio sp.]